MHLSTASPRFGHGRGPLACVARNFAAKGLGPIQFQGDGNHVCIYIYINVHTHTYIYIYIYMMGCISDDMTVLLDAVG